MIYCDHAATSFPKPESVREAVADFLARSAVSPGRSGTDLALAAGAMIDGLRADLVALFNAPGGDPDRCIFTANATEALNVALQGLCRPGDHVVATVLEHNSVLRPLHMLGDAGVISFDLAPCDGKGFVDPDAVAALIRPRTRLVVMTHASNVFGTLQPVAEVGRLCRERGVLFLVDAAQTAGAVPIDMTAQAIDALAFTGHKGLQGPTGTGGLLLGPGAEPRSTRWGGTGVRSEEVRQPEGLPYRLEAGTPNAAGLAGLAAGLAWLAAQGGPYAIMTRERELTRVFLAGCAAAGGVTVHGHDPADEQRHVAVVSVTVPGRDPERIGQFLDAEHDVAVRTGLQCAPLAHAALGTAQAGTVRFSFGPQQDRAQAERAAAALAAVAR